MIIGYDPSYTNRFNSASCDSLRRASAGVLELVDADLMGATLGTFRPNIGLMDQSLGWI